MYILLQVSVNFEYENRNLTTGFSFLLFPTERIYASVLKIIIFSICVFLYFIEFFNEKQVGRNWNKQFRPKDKKNNTQKWLRETTPAHLLAFNSKKHK